LRARLRHFGSCAHSGVSTRSASTSTIDPSTSNPALQHFNLRNQQALEARIRCLADGEYPRSPVHAPIQTAGLLFLCDQRAVCSCCMPCSQVVLRPFFAITDSNGSPIGIGGPFGACPSGGVFPSQPSENDRPAIMQVTEWLGARPFAPAPCRGHWPLFYAFYMSASLSARL